jgi:hypothetical protein
MPARAGEDGGWRYAATQEPANIVKEDLLFNNMSSNAVAKSAIETAGQHFDNNAGNTKVTRLNGNNVNTRVGPSIILKVMAGDIICTAIIDHYYLTRILCHIIYNILP